jgi:glycosyltransferase involved in cell wall biosynthesis
MRVALISFDFGEYCIRLASALTAEAEVLLLLPEERAAPHRSWLDPAVRLQTFAKPRLRQPLRQIGMISALLRRIRDFNPDVIHLQQGHLWFNFALPLLRRYPLVLTVHDARQHLGDKGAQKVPSLITKFGFHQAARVIVHGHQLRQLVIHDCRIPGDVINVVPHIAIGDDTAHVQLREEDYTVLFFGRLWPYKGLEYLIRAEPLIAQQVPEVKIIIAGQGEDFSRYRRMMIHPEHFIVHNEYVSQDKCARLFRQASIVVLPYIEASQSGVIPLACTFAKPVVATTVGSLPDLVEDGQTGYLVPPRDERALADAAVRLLRDRDLRHYLGANAKRKIDAECSPDVVARQTLAVYDRALNRPGRVTSKEEQSDPLDCSPHSAVRLHQYLIDRHWNGRALIGPDVGIRFNSRLGRFVKSYLRAIPWRDSYYYVQAQSYWILSNWRLCALSGEGFYRDVAVRCSDYLLQRQRDDGAWEYPNVEWKGRVATAEGTWGSLGLLESYRQTGERRFLTGALRWQRFLAETIGYQRHGEETAVNYFADRGGARVPNNTAFALRFLAELKDVTGDDDHLEHCAGLLTFLRHAQLATGEFPYTVPGVAGETGRSHFQCYQYNAFQCLDLMRYHELTGDRTALPLISGTLRFLREGQATDGHLRYDCGDQHRMVTYHTAVLGAAFVKATHLSIDGYNDPARRAYAYLLDKQRSDGGFAHSRGDYRLLSDQRSYPRNLAMILLFLLQPEIHARHGEHGQAREGSGHGSPAILHQAPSEGGRAG